MLDVARSRTTSNIAILLVNRDLNFTVVQGSFDIFFSSKFKDYIDSYFLRDKLPDNILALGIDRQHGQNASNSESDLQLDQIFLYQNAEKDKDFAVVFDISDGLRCIFINVDNKGLVLNEKVSLGDEKFFSLKQSKNGNEMLCLFDSGVRIIDLIAKGNVRNVLYKVNLSRTLHPYIREKKEYIADITSDGQNIFIGWDRKNGNLLTLTSRMEEEESRTIFGYNWETECSRDDIVPCWLAYERSKLVFFLEFNGENGIVSSICVYNVIDYPRQAITELEELASIFQISLFNMFFNGKTNIRLAFENKDRSLVIRLVTLAKKYGSSSSDLFLQGANKTTFKDFLDSLIEDKNEFGLQCLLNLIEEELVPLKDSAAMMENGFGKLWINYRYLIEQKIIENGLAKKICQIEVPVALLANSIDMDEQAQMGTIDNVLHEWEECSHGQIATNFSNFLHEGDLKDVKQSHNDATINAIVTVFTIANVCKIGLNGILRFLLMNGAKSHIFKTPLLKWVITYKWEKIWRRESMKSITFYAIFTLLYSIYSIWMAFSYKTIDKHMHASVWLTLLILILMTMALWLLYQEWIQMMTYIDDGKKLFPNKPIWGLLKYWSSPWNVVEVLTYLILILIISPFHFAKLLGHDSTTVLFIFIALETFLVWVKVWYFAQIIERTRGFVLMIQSVIKDSLPFLFLAFVLLIGFSITLFGLFQHSLQEKRKRSGEDDDVAHMIEQSFGNPPKAMLTLFYAMVGTFEPEIYYNSGSLYWIIVTISGLYLSLQMIIVLNTIIAAMGDTYDRVQTTEEELLLYERAKFIDCLEAQLSKNEIAKLEDSIKKYLYFLEPKDEDEIKLWQGRVLTIEEKVRIMIKESQEIVMTQINTSMKKIEANMKKVEADMNEVKQVKHDLSKMEKDISEIKDIKKDMHGITQMKDDIEKLKKDIVEIKEVKDGIEILKIDINDIKNMKEGMEQMRDTLQLIREKVSNL
eukprot:g7406.t1